MSRRPVDHRLSPRQARQMVDTAYLAAATALLWVALYYLPIGSPLFRLALPLPPAHTDTPPVLFVLLHNGEQFCRSPPVHPDPQAWAELLALSPAWPAP
jgi:hypothetical protein